MNLVAPLSKNARDRKKNSVALVASSVGVSVSLSTSSVSKNSRKRRSYSSSSTRICVVHLHPKVRDCRILQQPSANTHAMSKTAVSATRDLLGASQGPPMDLLAN